MSSDKVAVLGGTFDPIHIGHLIIAQSVVEKLDLTKCIFIPVNIPPHKDDTMLTSDERLKLVRMATEGDERFEVSDVEVVKNGVSYTYDTLNELEVVYGRDNMFFIVGSDVLYEFKDWHRYNELLKLAIIVVVPRRKTFVLFQKFSRSIDRGRWRHDRDEGLLHLVENKNRVVCVRTPIIEISSTMIRNRLRSGLTIKYLVPEKVERYLSERIVSA
ncbi:MAG: nicotinate (nicotinamide) nucleotide adenylyltransferase [Candidatus Coatesbacteria bacterium 4484_99]|uniref:Probable nicotinate-nucleotide adenylyltransferase n=1 Tax=Candidatus Coatesbacteria bacterium 4484_99 TaxID=1970774 RepID=A0A1W9S3G7_9BACT|nr:MAG: nicotinate (nicotinamide) nucleotide adenylyltransferase [Candidatus Coatesbacteria bacterium 4484_99]